MLHQKYTEKLSDQDGVVSFWYLKNIVLIAIDRITDNEIVSIIISFFDKFKLEIK